MITSSIVASLHMLTLALGLGSLFMRGIYLRSIGDSVGNPVPDSIEPGLKHLFRADNLWGIAALLWIATGLARAFGGLEKGTAFYLHSTMFLIKMILFAVVFALEIRPMITLIRWRVQQAQGKQIDTSSASSLAKFNNVELALAVTMVFVAGLMARGIGG